MNRSLIRSEILPFAAGLVALLATAAFVDVLLHLVSLVWIGRWLGVPGTLLIASSFAYSLRKRGILKAGRPADLLAQHERLAWVGSLLVLVHAGVHFNAWLPWLAVMAMLINVTSGLVGRVLLARARKHVEARRERLGAAGVGPAEVDRALFWDAVTYDAMKKWRVVHMPITAAFAVLALAHVASVLLLWRWR